MKSIVGSKRKSKGKKTLLVSDDAFAELEKIKPKGEKLHMHFADTIFRLGCEAYRRINQLKKTVPQV